MRNLMYTCAVALAIGCAAQSSHSAEPANAPAQPAQATAPAPAADATPAASATTAAIAEPAAPTDAAPEQDASSPEFQRAAKAYRQMEKDGQILYCRNEKRLGTRLGSPVCLTEAQLWERIHKGQDVRDNMRGPQTGACGSATAGC